MKVKTICTIVGFTAFFAALGIVGGIENGQPLSNAIWAAICLAVAWLSSVLAKHKA